MMFSNIGNIFSVKPRQAETTDTRLGIKRHDPEYEQRRKKKGDGDSPFSFDEDDNAVVSVEALRLFLEGFLRTQSPTRAENTGKPEVFAPTDKADKTRTPAPETRDGQAAMAANAYQHGAAAMKQNKPPVNIEDDEDSSAMAGDAALLPTEDVRLIHSLLQDLSILAAQNVEYLRIERGESFLQSLAHAVARARSH